MNTATPLARYEGLSMVMSPADALKRQRELMAFIKEVMVKDVDYGTIPGTPKPTLYQPGAQKLAELYGFATDFEDLSIVEDWSGGFFFYRKKCRVTSRHDGRFIVAGIGSCNSREDRYAWRWVPAHEVPRGLDLESLATKKRVRGIFRNELPKGANLSDYATEERISQRTKQPYTVYLVDESSYRVPNGDVYSLVNTIEKMACKRSLVAGIIGATRSAGVFTQDIEDMLTGGDRSFFGEAGAPSWVADAEGTDAETVPIVARYAAQIAAATTTNAVGGLKLAIKDDSALDETERASLIEQGRLRYEALKAAKEAKAAKEPADIAERIRKERERRASSGQQPAADDGTGPEGSQ